jgi:hypothetical protein
MITLKDLVLTSPLSVSQQWDRCTALFSDVLNDYKHLDDEQRGEIFQKVVAVREAFVTWTRVIGEELTPEKHEDIVLTKVMPVFEQLIRDTLTKP